MFPGEVLPGNRAETGLGVPGGGAWERGRGVPGAWETGLGGGG